MFLGHPRSGHSLIGSLLDAHPEIVCAHELGVLMHVFGCFSKKQVYYLLLKNSRMFTTKGRTSSGYSYFVPEQWQGKFKVIRAIGDKQGDGAVLRLQARPWLLKRLKQVINQQFRAFHIIRNPFDNIATISTRHQMTLSQSIEYYFSLSETMCWAKDQLCPDELFECRHEAFVAEPDKWLKAMCLFLGMNASENYLNSCKTIVFPSPRKTRHTGSRGIKNS